jgi:cobalamin biosynthesis protein CobT
MSMTNKQIPKDGYGKEQTIIGSGIRLKAKNLQTARSTTLKITGMDSGAVQYVNILVQTGISAEIPPDKREERKEERQEEEKRKEERQEEEKRKEERQEEEKRKEQRQEDERREERDKKDGRR